MNRPFRAALVGLLAVTASGSCSSKASLRSDPSAPTTATTAAPRSLGRCATPAPLGSDRAGFSPGGALPTSEPSAKVDTDLEGMRQAGAGWIRIDFNWGAIEHSHGTFSWGHLDTVVDGARCHGLRVLALPAYTPSWARARGTDDKHPPTDPARFAEFVVAAANHFGDKVAAWELWNEPDLAQFWSPRPDPAAYGRLLRTAAVALRAARPAATILSGGLAPANGADIDFLRAVIDAGGLGPVDGVAVHPYSYPLPPSDADSALNRLPKVHDLLVQRGLGGVKVWATEVGAPTGRSRVAVNDGLQAVSVSEVFRRWASVEWGPWTGTVFWYSWRDIGGDVNDPEQNFGLLRVDGSPKPALTAYREAVAGS